MDSMASLVGRRVLILVGPHAGEEGICLGNVTQRNIWAISPVSSDDVLELYYKRDFALLIDFSAEAARN
jgi:hypothetical protein